MNTIQVKREDGLAIITLNAPPLNLVSVEMTAELDETLADLDGDVSVRGLLLHGAGDKAFCAGSDIKEFHAYMAPGAVIKHKLTAENVMYSRLAHFRTPTVAAVTGVAFGGGLELAVCCDLIVADPQARFALPEVKLGVFPGSGGTVRVQRRIGHCRATEMTLLGEPIDAMTALHWGLINRVAEPGDVFSMAKEIAARFADGPVSQNLAKSALRYGYELPEDQAIDETLLLIDKAFVSQDCRVGVDAFRGKENPRFVGR
ncbi:MAG: enoyl-CoA hydratase/isomerase family protein [Pseudomonadota bacterium]